VSAHGQVSDVSRSVLVGIRSVSTYLTAPSAEAPDGVRVFEVNGVPFDFRGGGWSENLFLHYSASDLANQISMIKSMGLDGIRTEGKEMPQNFYDQMDRAGILIDAGFQCCDKWQPSGSGRGVTAQEFHVMYLSSLTIGQQLRDHPSVINFSWSDNPPIKEQEVASTEGFDQSGFTDPNISSAEYNTSAILGPSGEKEGPYDWVPPDYWYDTTHSSNNANDDDSTLTNVGGSFGFDSEQGSGDTVPTMDSIQRFLSPANQATLWQQPDAHQYHTNYESTGGQHSGYSFGTLDNLDTAIAHRYGQWNSLAQYVQEAQVQNYEDTRAQFEAYLDHWNNYPTPSTGTVYWQLNKGWPTMLWDLYNYDYDEAGAYFGAKKANEDLHVLYAYDTGTVTIDNLTGVSQPGLSVQSRVYDLSGQVLDSQTASGLSLAPQGVRLYPVGRLDIDTTGLILLTNDGELANRLTHPSFQVSKTYRATLAGGPVSAGALEMLRGGVELEDGRTAPAVVRPAPGARRSESVIELTISEGRNRQVRRMCAAVGHPVAALQRIAFGPLLLGDLEAGAHRQLSAAEIGRLRAL